MICLVLLAACIPAGDVSLTRNSRVVVFLTNPDRYQDWVVPAKERCHDAPFIQPSDGYIGYIWNDSFYPGHQHQGLDIFGGTGVGETPVYAVYDGYLRREDDWKSTLILRIPNDPLVKNRQIWVYYTHMAEAAGNSTILQDFPPGMSEKFVTAGTLLGYQGNYSGNTLRPVGVHLHISLVEDDGSGRYKNELEIENTIDPSPYFGLTLNASDDPSGIIKCK